MWPKSFVFHSVLPISLPIFFLVSLSSLYLKLGFFWNLKIVLVCPTAVKSEGVLKHCFTCRALRTVFQCHSLGFGFHASKFQMVSCNFFVLVLYYFSHIESIENESFCKFLGVLRCRSNPCADIGKSPCQICCHIWGRWNLKAIRKRFGEDQRPGKMTSWQKIIRIQPNSFFGIMTMTCGHAWSSIYAHPVIYRLCALDRRHTYRRKLWKVSRYHIFRDRPMYDWRHLPEKSGSLFQLFACLKSFMSLC